MTVRYCIGNDPQALPMRLGNVDQSIPESNHFFTVNVFATHIPLGLPHLFDANHSPEICPFNNLPVSLLANG
jgi:hypothetical protein